jgi:hypothetical protein
MGKHIKKELLLNWQEEELVNAMRAVRTSELSTNAATIQYKIPKRAYLAQNKHSRCEVGRITVLTPEQEQELCKRIIRLAQTGYHITVKMYRVCVST